MMRHKPLLVVGLLAVTHVANAQTPPGSMPAMPVMPAQQVPQLPAPPAAAPTLPEVSVPSVSSPADVAIGADVLLGDVPAPASASLPATAVDEIKPAAEATNAAAPLYDASGQEFSYGTSDLSLLFTPTQISRMKTVLSIYETARRNRTETPIEVVEELGPVDVPTAVIAEPDKYPVFTLKSIAYRDARDWTVWVGDLRITPRKNDQEVRVLAVSPNTAQLLWKPAYSEALQQRSNRKLFADSSKVRHKLTRPNTAVMDAAAGQVSFTLRPNQSFVPGYMATFEGKVASPELTKIEVAQPLEGQAGTDFVPQTPASGDSSAANPNNLDALLRAQQQPPTESTFRRALTGAAPQAEQPATPAAPAASVGIAPSSN